MAGMQTASGDYIDSSWELRVFVGQEDPEAETVTLRVTGESHIGGVILKIVEAISEYRAPHNTHPRTPLGGRQQDPRRFRAGPPSHCDSDPGCIRQLPHVSSASPPVLPPPLPQQPPLPAPAGSAEAQA